MLWHDYQLQTDNSYKFLLEEAVPKCARAVDTPIRVDFETLPHQLLQTCALPQNLIACFHIVDILPVLQLPLSLGFEDRSVSKKASKARRGRLVDHPLREPA